jgi:ABC-type transport system involved in cytochrome c biogenesis permease subunit
MLEYWIHVSPLGTFLATIVWCLIGMPAMVAGFYQTWKARQEAKAAREGTLVSRNCLEFVSGDGICINLVPLETLHSLPKPGDVILLPGHGVGGNEEFIPGAYLVETIEHIYTRSSHKGSRPQEARLTKAVAKVKSLNPSLA